MAAARRTTAMTLRPNIEKVKQNTAVVPIVLHGNHAGKSKAADQKMPIE
jgi:hypothetical protein